MYAKIVKLFVSGYGKYKAQVVVLMLLGLLSGLLEGMGIAALIPLFSRLTGTGEANDLISKIIGTFLGWFDLGFGLKALLPFIILAFIFKSALLTLSQFVSVKIAVDYEKEIRSSLFANTLGARWKFLIGQKVGHLETILLKDVVVSSSLFIAISAIVIGISSLLVYVVIALTISPAITLLSLALGAGIFFILKPFFYRIREESREAANTNSEMAHHVNENMIGLKTIKASSVEEHVSKKAVQYFDLLRKVTIKVSMLNTVAANVTDPVAIIFITGVFAVVFLSGNFDIGVFGATMYLVHRIFQHTQSIQTQLYKMNERIPYLQRLIGFENSVLENKEYYEKAGPFALNDRIEFSNVNFSYGENTNSRKILSDFKIAIKKGEMIGIIGESGAGKTTIVDLLLRLFTPVSGKILVDGRDISEIDIKEWRSNIGYVSQDAFIINDTIEANIKFHNSEVKSEDIIKAAKMANIYDFIQAQSLKFKTQVGERGLLLSGGEKQRLVLARYLARNPQILVLDEATSALDNKSELMIQRAIEALKGKVTMLVIAHRLSTILNCDRVISLENGKVKDEDRPESLLKDKSSYFYKVYNIRDNTAQF